ADVLRGGGGSDVIDGGGGSDTLDGGDGDDTIRVGNGRNSIDGGGGNDTVDYSAVAGSVVVDLRLGTAFQDGMGGQDPLLSIERIIGSSNNDVLSGDASNNVLEGGTGNDVLTGGSGADRLDGGAGFDTVDYSAATGAVVVDLRPGTAFQDGMGSQDTLVSIENIVGSSHNDVLSGDANNNVFEGGAGDDNLIGNGGDDTLNPGTGIDQVDGGDGTDRLVLDWSSIGVASAADGIVTDLFDAHGSLVDDPSKAVEWVFHTALSTDHIVSVRNVEQFDIAGTSADDTLVGGVFTGTLAGGFGNDFLAPGLGVNTLIGGPGNDLFVGSGAMFNGDQIIDLAVGDRIRFILK
ncbi:MAG: hypothetical protein NFW16_14275, partial [Candidatus Accumulibacter sp.]|nr:hypothetical protein [Accumulibacter sp.]